MIRPTTFAVLLLCGTAVPATAQDHSGHAMHRPQAAPMPTPDMAECEAEVARHRAMGHRVPDGACVPGSEPVDDQHESHSHGVDSDHMDDDPMPDSSVTGGATGAADTDSPVMDHGPMDHEKMPSDIPILPPPASAGSGPPRAAAAIWGVEAMRASRRALARENGGMTTSGIMLDRFEYRAREGEDGFLWDGDAWYGGDLNRVWIVSEGEGSFDEGIENAEVSVLYGRAISPWFDLQAGVRQDLTGPERTYLDLGIQGLAPYLFEVEADVYLSTEGDLTASAEVELDQRITQRLVVQPRAEIALSAQDVPELGIGSGIDTIEVGLRLRYEIVREFAPYMGIEQEWKVGGSADYAKTIGDDPSTTNYVVGLRFWF